MSQFAVSSELQDDIPILRVKGYYEKPAGQQVAQAAEAFLGQGSVHVILDLTTCDILTSPGVSTIVELAVDIADIHSGKLIICGLDKLKEKVLTLVGIQSMAEVVPTLAEAITTAKHLKKGC